MVGVKANSEPIVSNGPQEALVASVPGVGDLLRRTQAVLGCAAQRIGLNPNPPDEMTSKLFSIVADPVVASRAVDQLVQATRGAYFVDHGGSSIKQLPSEFRELLVKEFSLDPKAPDIIQQALRKSGAASWQVGPVLTAAGARMIRNTLEQGGLIQKAACGE